MFRNVCYHCCGIIIRTWRFSAFFGNFDSNFGVRGLDRCNVSMGERSYWVSEAKSVTSMTLITVNGVKT